ncbi:MAG: MFS transporter [Pseudomonadota bacterium]
MRWRILLLLFLARISLGFQFQTLVSVGGSVADEYALDYAEIGLFIGFFMTPGIFLALPAGLLGGYVSDKTLTALGLALLAAGGIISALGGAPWMIGLGRLLAGVGLLLTTLYLVKMIADWFPPNEIATAMSLLVISWPIGIGMGQIGHTYLEQAIGWRMAFMAASVYCALSAIAILTLYRSPDDRVAPPGSAGFRLTGSEWKLVIIAGLTCGAFNAAYIVYTTFAPIMLEAFGASPLNASATISLGNWLLILSAPMFGVLVDRTGRRTLILTICSCIAAFSFYLIQVPSADLPANLLFGLIGFAPAGAVMALAGDAAAPERRAFGMSVFFAAYFVMMTVCPPISGAIYDATGTAASALWFGAVLFLLVIPGVVFFDRIRRSAN